MGDLISRCELFNRLASVQTLGEAYGIIQEMPTVDAVPVVRCHECVHKEYCCRTIRSDGRKDEDYCSYGEKDGEQA